MRIVAVCFVVVLVSFSLSKEKRGKKLSQGKKRRKEKISPSLYSFT